MAFSNSVNSFSNDICYPSHCNVPASVDGNPSLAFRGGPTAGALRPRCGEGLPPEALRRGPEPRIRAPAVGVRKASRGGIGTRGPEGRERVRSVHSYEYSTGYTFPP